MDDDKKQLSQEQLADLTRQRDQLRGIVHKIDESLRGIPRANRHSRRAANVAERRAERKAEKAAARAAAKERGAVAEASKAA